MTTTTVSVTVEQTAMASGMRSWNTALQTTPSALYPSFGPLPGVVGVLDQSATWDVVGDSRTLQLSDGGVVVETITASEPGSSLAFELTGFRRLLGHLVSGVRADWSFEGEAGRCRIRWTCEFRALSGRGWMVRCIVAALWRPYMRQALPAVVELIEARR